MTKRVRFSIAARQQLDHYADYIGRESPQSGERFLDAVRMTQTMLERFPGFGHEVSISRLGVKGLRRCAVAGFRNHFLAYVERGESVDVLVVSHAARDLPRVLRALLKDPDVQRF